MRIIFFIRVNNDGEIKRSDFNDIIRRLSKKGDETEVYDTATASHYRVTEADPPELLSRVRLRIKIKAVLLISRLFGLYSFSRKNRGRYDLAHF
ncbi:MAG: hypothetical protein IH593_02170, partial [Bacteroidales bacterium]|nr:hypothetical protein [Bacteroidales bacterium]